MVAAGSISRAGQPIKRVHFDTTALRVGRAVAREPGPNAIGYLSNGPVVDGIETKTDYRNVEVIVVDNGSREPETLEYLAKTRHRVVRDDGGRLTVERVPVPRGKS